MSESDTPGKLIRVQDSGDVKEFVGTMLSEVSTETSRTTRWTEMTLYKMTDGTDRYVLHVIGRSVIYHQYGGRCNSGVKTNTADLDAGLLVDLEPCFECKPVNNKNVPLDDTIALEEDRYTVYVCPTPQDVITRLRHPRMGGRTAGVISGPGQRLLNEAAIKDDGIHNVITTVVRI